MLSYMRQREIASVYRRLEKLILSLGLLALFVVGHSVLNELAHMRPRRYLPELIRDHVPFIPPLIAIYLLSFAVVFVPALVIRDRAAFRRTAAAFFLVIVVSFVFFLALPLTVQRIEEPPGDDVFTGMLRWFQSVARPHNTFPSLHAALCTLAAASCFVHRRRVGIVLSVYAVLVVFSTLSLKLHNVLDMIAGLFLAGVVSIWLLRKPRTEDPETYTV